MENTTDTLGGDNTASAAERLRRQDSLQQYEDKLQRLRSKRDYELRRIQDRLKSNKPTFDHLEHTDKSRRHIAFVFVYGYIITVGVIILGVPLYNWLAIHQTQSLELEKVLAQVGALIGSPLGFVVGYYFKEDSRK